MYNKFLSFFLFLLCFTGFSQDFEVAPVVMKFEVEPGGIETRKLSIKNHGSQRQAYQLSIGDFEVVEGNSKKSAKAGSTDATLVDWLTVNPSFIDLNPNEQATVEVIMRVPAGKSETRWGFIFVQAIKEQIPGEGDKSLSTGVNLLPRINVVVTQSPRSNKRFAGKIGNLALDKEKNDNSAYRVEVKNVGDKIINGSVNLSLANLKTAVENKFDKLPVTLYPGQSKVLEFNLPEGVEPGRYALATIFDFGSKSSLEGTQIMIDIP